MAACFTMHCSRGLFCAIAYYTAYTWVVGISGDCTCCAGRIYIKWSLVMPHIHKVVTWHLRYPQCGHLAPEIYAMRSFDHN